MKFNLGEFVEKKNIFNLSPYVTYFAAFVSLFAFGIGIRFLRNNFKNPLIKEQVSDKSLSILSKGKKDLEKNIFYENKKDSYKDSKLNLSEKNKNLSIQLEEITSASPSIEQIK